MRLIDADAVSAMTATCPEGMDIDSFIAGMGAVLDRVYEAPTVDAVPVVRCRDCKWLGIGARGDGTRLVMCCKKGHDTTEDDYCSEGVNREDDPSD